MTDEVGLPILSAIQAMGCERCAGAEQNQASPVAFGWFTCKRSAPWERGRLARSSARMAAAPGCGQDRHVELKLANQTVVPWREMSCARRDGGIGTRMVGQEIPARPNATVLAPPVKRRRGVSPRMVGRRGGTPQLQAR
jgi:hypothetical protein